MGPVLPPEIAGAKGGSSKPKTPVEAPDSLRSTNIAKILLAVGEGEFEGTPTAKDIYLDNTPLQDASGNMNFPGVKWEWRRGTVEQSYIQGIPAVESETSVNVELRSDTPWTRTLSNTQLSAVRLRFSWPRLVKQDSKGNTNGYTIEYAIDIATDGGAFVQAHRGAVSGKTTNGYQRSVRVDLPDATSGWVMRVRRITPNANSGTIADTMTIAAYTEIIDEKLRYPNTALLYIQFDAEQFQNIPSVTVKCKARRWPVPSNYDPINRTYTGTWDGTFKQAWTNNPAFVTYGLCVEDRFGLGKRIKSWMVDKWEMYRIAQYCDQLVPNGVGGQEPRFLCDMNLQGKAEAWTLLRDLSAIYRGMVYWAQGSLFMQADMPRAQDFDYVFTRANVINGEFTYGGAERSTHYSRALVSYDNPANNYDTDVIPVTDVALQRRYQDRPIEISAIGCTRASEAQRRGKWALLSNNQDRTVTFRTGMEGRIPLPGHVIPVADELLSGRPNGGRISAAAGRVVTLDRDTQVKPGDRLIINLPNGSAQGRTVQSVNGRAVTVTTAYSVPPEPELQWAIDASDLAVQLFRVLKTSRTAEGEYEITGLEFNPSKFAAIDTGAKLQERPISIIPITVVPPPASVTLSSASVVSQGIAVSTMTIDWPAVQGAVAYDVEWRKDDGNWVRLQRVGTTSVDVVGIYAGAYLARVRAVSAFDITSMWRDSMLTELKGKEGLPPAVTFLTATSELFAIRLKWGLPAGAEDTQRTEIWYGPTTDREQATKLADLAYPQSEHLMQGLAAGAAFFFWARLVDRSGNIGPWYPVEPNVVQGIASTDAGPILEMISGKITESELGQDLLEEIQKIPGLQDQIDALGGLTAYDKDSAYTKDQMVVADGKIYQAKQAVPANSSGANAPPNTTYWIDVGQSLVTANGLAQQVATNTVNISTVDGKVTAQAASFEALRASTRDDDGSGAMADALKGWESTAALATESRVRSTENMAMAERLTTFDARVATNEANITSLERVVATNESATAQKIDQLNVSVGENSAAIQQTSTAFADTSGKLSTMWSVKMQLNAQGQYVAAGFGLGIENGPAGLQSQFLVSADRFAVVNGINGTLSSPFVVQGGQVFISQAFINSAFIQNLIVGMTLKSQAVDSQGRPLLELNFVTGAVTIRGQSVDGSILLNNNGLYVYDNNGVERTAVGRLS
ncbi:phage tail protein [Pseudomonas guariconensis]|uniref:phage tail protein n=1 Tax=Pseudomonas guariconensis TaxID=1288410 RepID=UPI003F691B99